MKPKTNAEFWEAKRLGNRDRDRRNIRTLRRDGWDVLVIWECQTRAEDRLKDRLLDFLGD